jgi:RHS repeat-associated protein
MTYDLVGQRIGLNNPDRGLVEYTYDLAGNLVKKVDGNLRSRAQAINYVYEYNRLQKTNYPESIDVEYFYGAPGALDNRAGRLYKTTDASGIAESFFGKLGEAVKTVRTMNFLVPGHEPWTFTTESGYDYLGRVQWLTYPDGEKLSYVYDQGGLIKAAYGERQTDHYDFVKQISYDEFGQRVYIKYGNDIETRYTYDPYRRWLDNIHTGNSLGGTLQNMHYTFDKVGNVLGLENKAQHIIQSFQYDDLYQLVRAEGNGPDKHKNKHKANHYIQTFSYDTIGNMTRKTSYNQITPGNHMPKELNFDFTYLYNGTKPHAPSQIENWEYQYDDSGNTVVKSRLTGAPTGGIPGGGTSGEYFWDEENRLILAKVNGMSTDYLYDASGTCTAKRGPGGETLYVSQFYQLQNRQRVTKHFFVGNTRVVSKLSHYNNPNGLYDSGYEKKNIYTYHPDHLGSANYITDPRGKQFEHIEYTPYGETWIDDGTNLNIIDYRFTSKELDKHTGLYYFGARYLDPQNSRWLSPDPILDKYLPEMPLNDEARERNKKLPGQGGVFNPLNMQMYHYAANNPVKYVDPDGQHTLVYEGGNSGTLTYSGDDGTMIASYSATSGVPGITDRKLENKGPIPLGTYTLDPKDITGGFLKFLKREVWDRQDWGYYRVPLHPKDGTDTGGREGFFLHGGLFLGSAGCIDVGLNDRDLFPLLMQHDGPITFTVLPEKYDDRVVPGKREQYAS